jgi:GNAT superfamily N-acetyltransferase
MVGFSVIIRSAAPQDAQRIHQLHVAAVRALCAPHYAPEIVEGWLANRSARGYLRGIRSGAIVVAEMESRVVGFGEGVPGEVASVFVDPAFANRGIGSALLEDVLRRVQDRQGPVRLESTLDAVGFHERFGFSQAERLLVQRNQVKVPVVVMHRHAG